MKTVKLPLKIHNQFVENVVCVATNKDSELGIVLSEYEVKKYNSFLVESAQMKYLLGRYSAKHAYKQIAKYDSDLSKIEIRNGIFGQPLLNDNRFDLSISHTKDMGASIVFDKLFPMGIDIETVKDTKISALKSMTTQDEINNCCQKGIKETIALTISWCFKEALSKILKTGISIPFRLFEIEYLISSNNGFVGTFLNFPQYKGYAQKITDNTIIAFVYPKQLILDDIKDI